jgi:hypothetical protein
MGEVSDSNLGRDINKYYEGFCGFTQSLKVDVGIHEVSAKDLYTFKMIQKTNAAYL